MYTIKQAAARSGLTVPTVRVWERRYGVIHPERTATGYRLYDDGAIDRLIAMRHLVEGLGMRPSQAAERLSSPEVDVDGLVAEAMARPNGGRRTARHRGRRRRQSRIRRSRLSPRRVRDGGPWMIDLPLSASKRRSRVLSFRR